MRPPRDTAGFVESASIRTNDAVNARVLQRMRAAYEGAAGGQAAASRSRIARWAVAAAVLIAGGALVSHLAQLVGGNVAWAEVSRRFQSVPFFSATIYMKRDAVSEPTQMELWMSQDGHIRLRAGKHVVFAHGGRVKAYDIGSRRSVEPDEMARVFIDKIGQAGEFSLEAIIEVMFGGQTTEVTPLINPDAVISQDVVVFDVTLPDTPEWVRIWALRESRLPVRITVWDPRDGANTDAIFSYSREQQGEFFDPNAFDAQLQDRSSASRVSVAYAFLKDPGGRNITPEEMFKESGYHIPLVRQAGFTEDGAFWVLADKARNQRPSGSIFYGFSEIEDDLSRTYIRVANNYHSIDNVSLSVFVPLDFPFDSRRPSRITLICTPRQHPVPGTDPASEVIGTVGLTRWESDAPCPELYEGIDTSSLSFRMALARHLAAPEHVERLNRLLSVIPGWTTQPESHAFLLFWQEMAYRRKDFREILKIGQVLSPLLFEDLRNASRYHFTEYLVALAATGQLADANRLFHQVDAIADMSPDKSGEYYGTYLRILIESLAGEARLTMDQIGRVLGFDIAGHEVYRRAAEQGVRNASWAETHRVAEQRRAELAAYYRTHPLPERAELIDRGDDRTIYLTGDRNVLPGCEGYKILPVNYAISGVVSNLRDIGADAAGANKVHPYGAALRFADGLEDRELRADLVYRDGIALAECFHLVLAGCGMELTTETLPARPVLIARHDGRKLRNYGEVYGPWHMDNGSAGVRVWRAADLLEQLSLQVQTGVLLLDQTGMTDPICVGNGTPQWQGADGIEQARRWLQEQLGITITEETRTVTTYLIQRRTQ